MKYGRDRLNRREFIKNLLSTKGSYNYTLKFQGTLQHLEVYRVPIDVPKYRLANGRTKAAQEEYLCQNPEIPKNYFESDPEVEEKQKIQHALLKQMLNAKGINLLEYFRKEVQEVPLILDQYGFVINGNRRLCTFRELYYSDTLKYKNYEYIEVVILPLCTEEDIIKLEVMLQIEQDITSDYTWINLACQMRTLQEVHGYDDEYLAELYKMEVKDVKKIFSLLDYGDQYLKSRNKEKRYSILEDKEYAFDTIRKCMNIKTREPIERDIFLNLAFMFIDNPEDTKMGRVYSSIKEIDKYLDEIEEELSKVLDLEKYSKAMITEEYDQMHLFEEISVDDADLKSKRDKVELLEKELKAIQDENNRRIILDTIKDTIEREKNLLEASNKENFVLRQLAKANANIQDAINGYNEKTKTTGIEIQIDSILENLEKLKSKVKLC